MFRFMLNLTSLYSSISTVVHEPSDQQIF